MQVQGSTNRNFLGSVRVREAIRAIKRGFFKWPLAPRCSYKAKVGAQSIVLKVEDGRKVEKLRLRKVIVYVRSME